ncbi:fimbrial protein [Serratia sp. S1B]|nr:fimbrial protein [Serratia sp. S1B]
MWRKNKMKLRLWLFSLSSLGMASNAMATCIVSPLSGLPVPHYFTIPDTVIHIDADTRPDTSNPIIAPIDTPKQGYDIKFDQCYTGDLFGKSVMNLSNQGASYIFPSNISGIGVKILWNNGAAFSNGQFPTTGKMDFSSSPNNIGSWIYPAASFYRVEFYKTSDTLNLDPQAANMVLMQNNYAYNWVTSDAIGNAGQVLQIGSIQVISTPSCNFENSKTVDFGTVTGNMLATGSTIEKPLAFSITCRTDYGTYSVNTSLSSESASSDGSYIKVKDSVGSTDTLAIRIKKNDGTDIKVDGSTTDTLQSVASNTPAQFSWKAMLMSQPGVQAHPAEGNFTARAEILLQVK